MKATFLPKHLRIFTSLNCISLGFSELNSTIWGSCFTAALQDLQLLPVRFMSIATEGKGQVRSLSVTKGNN